MAVYQGFNGSLTFNGSTLAQCQGWELVTSLDILEYSGLGDKWKRNAGGQGGWSGTASCKLDYATGQKEFIDDIFAATPTLVGATGVFTTATSDTITGTVIPNSITLGTRNNELVTFEVAFTGDGAPTLSM